jgi:hypothetical protein
MRKPLAWLLVWLSMLVCQLGAVQHEINHLEADHWGRDRPVHTHASATCDTCLAYASLARAAVPSVVPLLPPRSAHRWVDAAMPARLAQAAPSPRSRGPPSIH